MIGTPRDAPRTQSARHVQPHSSPRSSSLFRYTAELEAKQKEAEEPKLRSQKLKLKHRKLHTAYKAADDAAKEAEKKVREMKSYIDEKTPQVQAVYGDRVVDDEGRTAQQLQAAYEKMNRQLKKQQEKHGGKSIDELRTTAEKHVQKLNEKREELKIVIRTKEESEKAQKERYKFWRTQVKLKSQQASADFNMYLSKKQHAGVLHFNHDHETCGLEVSRNSQDANAKSIDDARSLSGGERSFTTLAFELAMWNFCETPVRVLDEFDVYMDDTYRKRAVDTLMDLCDTQPLRQFIFITPQDMYPFLADRGKAGSVPKIVRMEDVR